MLQCTSCIFSNPEITPLAPREVKVPVLIMFIGENPSWADKQDEPFASSTISGYALENYYLKPLQLKRDEVWITDLIKCRYPRKSKWQGYPLDIYSNKTKCEKEIQKVAKKCSKLWLVKEIEWARPPIVVTLSDSQVYQRLRRAFGLGIPATFLRAVGKPNKVEIEGFETILFPMIHPDISRPIGDDNRKVRTRKKWVPLHQEHEAKLQKLLMHIRENK